MTAVDDTPNLRLPYIMAAQSQKHVTHNEAIRALDAVVQLAVLDRDLAAPPVSPAEGDRYIVAANPTGDSGTVSRATSPHFRTVPGHSCPRMKVGSLGSPMRKPPSFGAIQAGQR
jgi:hypothetical protein